MLGKPSRVIFKVGITIVIICGGMAGVTAASESGTSVSVSDLVCEKRGEVGFDIIACVEVEASEEEIDAYVETDISNPDSADDLGYFVEEESDSYIKISKIPTDMEVKIEGDNDVFVNSEKTDIHYTVISTTDSIIIRGRKDDTEICKIVELRDDQPYVEECPEQEN